MHTPEIETLRTWSSKIDWPEFPWEYDPKIITLWDNNPRKMSSEEFEKAPGLLYHGTHSDFTFDRNYDYESHRVIASATLWYGLYLGNSQKTAEEYSQERKKRALWDYFDSLEKISENPQQVSDSNHGLKAFLPYRARMLDFRDWKWKNLALPPTFIDAFYHFICHEFSEGSGVPYEQESMENYLRRLSFEDRKKIVMRVLPNASTEDYKIWMLNINWRLASNLDKIHSLNKESKLDFISVRMLLLGDQETVRNNNWIVWKPESLELKSLSNSEGMQLLLFGKFMVQNGIDGIIYLEGSDWGAARDWYESYVFYNLNVIGDYRTWMQDGVKDRLAELTNSTT